MLNGNIGVMKSMMAELTDETNMARGFSLIPVTWAVGGTIGFDMSLLFSVVSLMSSPIGPSLVVHFWGEYPYFLPCLATAAYALLSFTLAAIFLKETVNSCPIMQSNTEANSDLPHVGEGELLDAKDTGRPLPLRALLTRPVMVSVANYCMISLLETIAARHETCIHWFMDDRIWVHQRHLSIRRLPAYRRALRPAAHLYRPSVLSRSTSCSPLRTWHYMIPFAARA
ncbi:hypothetical protein EDB85DRAFT_498800 [Lactarius pseudohatsudake]|nr:hypothetical protein EDB85DRAFT_498800 [Lactarius pseudohatsudake]